MFENDPNHRFDLIFGTIQPGSDQLYVSGVQGPGNTFTQDFCTAGPPAAGSRTYTCGGGASPTPTPTASCTPSWFAGPNMPITTVRAAGVYFPANGKFYAMGGRSSDVAGSDFTHPFEYDPATNGWTTKAAAYPDNQVNNMACGVLTDAGTPYITA